MNGRVDIEHENVLLREQLHAKDQRIAQLESLLKQLRQQHFGTSSEKLSADQIQLFDEAESIEAEDMDESTTTIPPHTRRKAKRVSIPVDLPREEIVYDLPEADRVCPHDGSPLKAIGEETHEQLDIIPAQIKVLKHIRKKYACPCCEQYLITANKPKQPIEKSIASPGLLAYIATGKYCDALPLYRQIEIFKRIGIELDRTTLANWMIRCGELIQPLINRIHEQLLEQHLLHMDETPVQVLNEPNKMAQSKSYMWVLSSLKSNSSPAVLFHYNASRSQDTPKQQLHDYHGALMVDGYEGYQAVCNENSIIRLGCWAHARRKFIEAKNQQPKGKTGKADQALSFIQKLYLIERQANDQQLDAEQRYRLRQQQAKPILDKLKQWLDKTLNHTPPKNSLGKAVSYLHSQWSRLIGYLEHGDYPIDNNRAENAIRPFVIGRKNWLFSNSQRGASASANLYSLIESAKLNELEPYAYLKQVLTMLPNAETLDEVDALLPWNYKSGVG
jgi:transposase